jgi:hypothetical protein
MAKRNFVKDDAIPGLWLLLDFPFKTPLSAKRSVIDKFDIYCKKHKTYKAKKMREFLFDFFGAKNEVELLSKNKTIRDSINNVIKTIKDEMGVDSREFSQYFSDKIKLVLEEDEKIKV